MDRKTTTELMRLLKGELPDSAARELVHRLEREPALRQDLESLERLWQSLDLPEPQPAPPGFAARVTARALDTADEGLVPAWWGRTLSGKVATAVLLAGGITLGAILAAPSEAEDWSEYLDTELSMAESYLLVMEEPEEASWPEVDS